MGFPCPVCPATYLFRDYEKPGDTVGAELNKHVTEILLTKTIFLILVLHNVLHQIIQFVLIKTQYAESKEILYTDTTFILY